MLSMELNTNLLFLVDKEDSCFVNYYWLSGLQLLPEAIHSLTQSFWREDITHVGGYRLYLIYNSYFNKCLYCIYSLEGVNRTPFGHEFLENVLLTGGGFSVTYVWHSFLYSILSLIETIFLNIQSYSDLFRFNSHLQLYSSIDDSTL